MRSKGGEDGRDGGRVKIAMNDILEFLNLLHVSLYDSWQVRGLF